MFDGIAALHFCFACAAEISIDESVAMQAAKATSGVCFLIQYLMQLHARPNQKRGTTGVQCHLQIWSQWVENWANRTGQMRREARPLGTIGASA